MMNKLKIFLIILLAIIFVWNFRPADIKPAFAQARYGNKTSQPIESTGILTDQDGVTMDYPVWVYSISIFADAASSFAGIYDCDTIAELVSIAEKAKDEIGEATQYDTATKPYSNPVYYSDGIGVIMDTGVFSVEYGPEP